MAVFGGKGSSKNATALAHDRPLSTLSLDQIEPMEHPAYTLSALCAIGGVGGYVRRGSVPSLAAGIALGGLYGYSGKLLHENADYGIELASASSALLIAGMLPRAIKTKKPVPITLSIVGFTALAYYGKKYADYNL